MLPNFSNFFISASVLHGTEVFWLAFNVFYQFSSRCLVQLKVIELINHTNQKKQGDIVPMLLFLMFNYFLFTNTNVCLYNVKEWSVIYDGLFKRANK
ncbi:hypothetical protein D352_00056 [Enterococcus faecium LA4B-2]|nr:hypothetical protein D352_00056 [Enterococcus faecium LA4B-2]